MRRIFTEVEAIVARPTWQTRAKKLGVTGVTVEPYAGNSTTEWKLVFKFTYNKRTTPITFHVPFGVFWGCCGIKIVHEVGYEGLWAANNTYLGPVLFRHGVATLLMQAFMDGVAAARMPGQLVAATTKGQVAGVALLKKLGWKRTGTPFRNPQTDQIITMWRWKVPQTARDTEDDEEF